MSWPSEPPYGSSRSPPEPRHPICSIATIRPIIVSGAFPFMDIRKSKKLIELLEESGIAEIEIKEGEEALRISRMPTGGLAAAQFAPMPMALPAAAPMAAPMPAAAPVAVAPAAAKAKANEHVITAPMVGTFYGAPSPGAKAFVE